MRQNLREKNIIRIGKKFYKPENEKVDYYKSTHEFMVKNPYFVRYLKKHDSQLLEQIKKDVEQTEDIKQGFPHPHDSVSDEEDNFC